MAGGDYDDLFFSKTGTSRVECTYRLGQSKQKLFIAKGSLSINELDLYDGHVGFYGVDIWVKRSAQDVNYLFVLAASRDGEVAWGGISGYMYHGDDSIYYPIRADLVAEYLGWTTSLAIENSEEYSPFVLAEDFLSHIKETCFEMMNNPDPRIGKPAIEIQREYKEKMDKIRAERGMV